MKLIAWIFLGIALLLAFAANNMSFSCPTGCAWLQMPWDVLACNTWLAVCPTFGAFGFWIPMVGCMLFLMLAWYKMG